MTFWFFLRFSTIRFAGVLRCGCGYNPSRATARAGGFSGASGLCLTRLFRLAQWPLPRRRDHRFWPAAADSDHSDRCPALSDLHGPLLVWCVHSGNAILSATRGVRIRRLSSPGTRLPLATGSARGVQVSCRRLVFGPGCAVPDRWVVVTVSRWPARFQLGAAGFNCCEKAA